MDLIQKAKALCLSACLEAVIAIICICAYAIAVDVRMPFLVMCVRFPNLVHSQEFAALLEWSLLWGRDGILFKHLSKLRNISLHREISNTQKSIYCKSNTQSDELLCLVTQ